MAPVEAIALAGVLLVGLAVLGAGLWVAIRGLSRMRTARRLREAGPLPLADVPEASGLVEFAGTARSSDAEPLEAPLSGEPCLAYTVQSRAPAAAGDAATGEGVDWRVDGGAAASVPFLLEDGTDRVRVDPANAVLSLDLGTAETEWHYRTDLDADARDRLAPLGLPGLDADGGDGSADSSRRDGVDRQYRERRLEPGAEVRVFGGSVTDESERESGIDAPVTVAGDDWFEISTGEDSSGATVLSDRRRSGSLYVIFGGLLAVPGIGLTLASIVGLVTVLLL